MNALGRLIIVVCMGLSCTWFAPLAIAQVKSAPPQITFNSFTGVYHLSRDNRGLSLLTTEETILADFPGTGSFYGITRTIPNKYQGHSVNVKILNIEDAAGNDVPYKTTTDSSDNIVITTGDPAITLYGRQTIKIKYQTSGVINLRQKSDEFLLNINGRGWDQPFGRVNTTLFIPSSFNASLSSNPSCYKTLGKSISNDCKISIKKDAQQTTITSTEKNIAAHQAIVLKLEFASSTFTNNKQPLSTIELGAISAILIILGVLSIYAYNKRKA
jgi:hypothetical protein